MKKKISHIQQVTWVDIEAPNKESQEFLRQRYAFHALDLNYHEQRLAISKFDMHQRYVFVVIQVPVRYRAGSTGFATRELEIFLGPDMLVTLHHEPFEELDSILREIDREIGVDASPLMKTPGYVLHQLLIHLTEISLAWIEHVRKDGAVGARERGRMAMQRLARVNSSQLAVAQELLSLDVAYAPLALNAFVQQFANRTEHIAQEADLLSLEIGQAIAAADVATRGADARTQQMHGQIIIGLLVGITLIVAATAIIFGLR